MQVKFNVNDKCQLVIDVPDVTRAFQFIAYVESVFGVDRCGNCKSNNLQLTHRQPKGYDYYSVTCKDCRHEFKFGQVKETKHLFQKGWEPPYESDNEGGGTTDDGGSQGEPESQESSAGEPVTAGSTF